MDHSPVWLKKPSVQPPPWHHEPIVQDIDLRELTEFLVSVDESTHQQVIPKETHWTLPALRAMKESLLRQIEEEATRQEEIIQLKEECANLAHGLDWLRSHRNKTIGFP